MSVTKISRDLLLLFLLQQVLDVWIFGEIWCQGWLVVDVWMCTASILNLCAISVDRYLAVTRPVQYRSMMTGKRAKIVIFVVWLMSFLICFPPLVGWNGRTSFSLELHSPDVLDQVSSNNSNAASRVNFSSSSSTTFSDSSSSSLLTEEDLYSGSILSRDEVSSPANCSSPSTSCTLFNDKGYVIYSALGSFWFPMFFMLFFYWRIYLVASRTTKALKRGYKSTKTNKSTGQASPDERFTLRMHRGITTTSETESAPTTRDITHPNSSTSSPRFRYHDIWKKPTIIETQFDEGTCSTQVEISDDVRTRSMRLNPSEHLKDRNKLSPTGSVHSNLGGLASPSSSRAGSARSSAARASRRTNTGKFQARRFHAETKAAKTVGIIVGGFIICWLPFFTAYLIRAFCNDTCVPSILMSIFTWLGYCNSAINPVIYGLFSRDFRRAFKTIVCKCTFREEVGVSSLIRQIHLPTFLEEENNTLRSHDENHDFKWVPPRGLRFELSNWVFDLKLSINLDPSLSSFRHDYSDVESPAPTFFRSMNYSTIPATLIFFPLQ